LRIQPPTTRGPDERSYHDRTDERGGFRVGRGEGGGDERVPGVEGGTGASARGSGAVRRARGSRVDPPHAARALRSSRRCGTRRSSTRSRRSASYVPPSELPPDAVDRRAARHPPNRLPSPRSGGASPDGCRAQPTLRAVLARRAARGGRTRRVRLVRGGGRSGQRADRGGHRQAPGRADGRSRRAGLRRLLCPARSRSPRTI
jgi:hypothetical protein